MLFFNKYSSIYIPHIIHFRMNFDEYNFDYEVGKHLFSICYVKYVSFKLKHNIFRKSLNVIYLLI